MYRGPVTACHKLCEVLPDQTYHFANGRRLEKLSDKLTRNLPPRRDYITPINRAFHPLVLLPTPSLQISTANKGIPVHYRPRTDWTANISFLEEASRSPFLRTIVVEAEEVECVRHSMCVCITFWGHNTLLARRRRTNKKAEGALGQGLNSGERNAVPIGYVIVTGCVPVLLPGTVLMCQF